MKNLIGITCYPINETQVKMLNDCIDSLKPLGYDIMVLSHYPIDMDIQKKVNFVHYDSDNPFLPLEMNQHNFLVTEFFESKVFNSGHALAISKNMNTLFNFAQNMDYDYCICVEFDCKFNEDDILKISTLINNMKLNNKKATVFNPTNHIVASCHYENDGPNYCETCFFISQPKFFLDTFRPPRNINEWLNNDMCYTLEITLCNKLKHFESDVEFINSYSNEYFSKSDMNQHRYGMFNCEIIYNEKNPNVPILLIINIHNEKYKIDIFKNGKHFSTVNCDVVGFWSYFPFEFDDSIIETIIYQNNLYLETKKFELSLNKIENYKKKGVISFK
jgi:hypothetical protein